jgi:cobalt-zinc-cadmium efflux system outer membrane protein
MAFCEHYRDHWWVFKVVPLALVKYDLRAEASASDAVVAYRAMRQFRIRRPEKSMIVRPENFIERERALQVVLGSVCALTLAQAFPLLAKAADNISANAGNSSTANRTAVDSLPTSSTLARKSSTTTVKSKEIKTNVAAPVNTVSEISAPVLLPLHPVLDPSPGTRVAALPPVKTSQGATSFQNQPAFTNQKAPSAVIPSTNTAPAVPSGTTPGAASTGATPASTGNAPQTGGDASGSPPLRGPATLPAVTMPQSPMRKLHVDMGDTIPSPDWRAAGGPKTPAQQSINDVAAGLNPLKVREVMNEALVNSPKVSAIRLMLGINKSLYAAATQLPDPVFFRDEAPQSEGVRRVGPMITYEPPWKLAFRLLAAKRQVQETKLELLAQLWQFRNDVRRSFTEVVVAQETYETFHDLSELALKLQEVSSKRFQAGDVPELDVLKSRLAYSQASVDTAQGNMRVNRSRQQLNVIMGRQFGAPISAPRLPTFNLSAAKSELLPDFSIPIPPVTDFISEAMENRLELKINDAQIRLTKAQLLNAAGNIIPNPSVAFGSSTETNLPSGPKLNGLYTTINAEIPLYTFSQGDIARLKATLRQFKAQEAAIRNQIIADVTSAYNNLITARNRIQTYQDHVLADSAEVARLARRSYEVGQSDITATLAAQQANVQVRQAYLDAVSSYQQSFTDLERSIGEPID